MSVHLQFYYRDEKLADCRGEYVPANCGGCGHWLPGDDETNDGNVIYGVCNSSSPDSPSGNTTSDYFCGNFVPQTDKNIPKNKIWDAYLVHTGDKKPAFSYKAIERIYEIMLDEFNRLVDDDVPFEVDFADWESRFVFTDDLEFWVEQNHSLPIVDYLTENDEGDTIIDMDKLESDLDDAGRGCHRIEGGWLLDVY